jgi:hypothetical protein
MHKKGEIGGLKFWSSGVEYISLIKQNWLSERGKFWKYMKNVDFHMILPSIKI